MRDIWGFLLQTLTASGVAVLLLCVKRMLMDKLPSRWQFAVWGVLAAVLMLPAGLNGRYVLFNWPFFVEAAKTVFAGDYSLSQVVAPVPLPRLEALGEIAGWGPAEWCFAGYCAGAVFLSGRYFLTYIRLRLFLRREAVSGEEASRQVRAVAAKYELPVCTVAEVPGLPTAFVCGLFSPVLALPAGEKPDGKVILHELLHLKHHDVLWGLVICVFRCLHWCNPLLWHCADRAQNDLEAFCDQRVLERLEGEERRDYGRILLSMADERYSRTPGTSSLSNGGRNISRRIEAIARFRLYPQGMTLVSVCAAVVLAAPLISGARVENAYDSSHAELGLSLSMASARTTWCTTCAGALDVYAKAVLTRNGVYRAMCAPIGEQRALAEEIRRYGCWQTGLAEIPVLHNSYSVYNLRAVEGDAYEGLLAVDVQGAPEGETWDGTVIGRWMAVQEVRVEKQGGRWVVLPLASLRMLQGDRRDYSYNAAVPSRDYEAQGAGFLVRVSHQTVIFPTGDFDVKPRPDAEFEQVYCSDAITGIWQGDEEARRRECGIQYSITPIIKEGHSQLPQVDFADNSASGGSFSGGSVSGGSFSDGDGSCRGNLYLEAGWGPEVWLGDIGRGGPESGIAQLPDAYVMDLSVNGGETATLILLPAEGGLQ